MKILIFILFTIGFTQSTSGATDSVPAAGEAKVRYKAGNDLNFEQLVIEGQLKRPEMSVVTGDIDENGNGLLRLRENFLDRMAEAAGEEAP
jgi:hypothetical protein